MDRGRDMEGNTVVLGDKVYFTDTEDGYIGPKKLRAGIILNFSTSGKKCDIQGIENNVLYSKITSGVVKPFVR